MAADGDIVIKLTLDGKDMTLELKEAGNLLRRFQGDVEQTAKSVKRLDDAQDSLGTKFRHLVLTLGNLRFAAMDLYDVFLRLPASILKTSGELERLQQQMTGLSNKTTDAARQIEGKANFDYVVQSAKNAPFAIGALAESFVKLKTAGIDPTNGSMQALIDSVAKFGGNDESLKRASVAIQQMAGKGVVSMEELRQQLGEAIPDAMQSMAIGMGLSMSDLAKYVSKGIVEANSALDKMLTVMSIRNKGAAESMMSTWVGAVSQIETEWALMSQTIAEGGFADEMKKTVRELTQAMRSPEFQNFASNFGAGLGEAVKDISKGVKVLLEYRSAIGTLIEGWLIYKGATSFLFPALKGIESAIGTVTGAITQNRLQLESSAKIQNEVAQMNLRNKVSEAQAEEARLAQIIANKQRELATVQATNAAIIADYKAVQAAAAGAYAIREATPGVGGVYEQVRMANAQQLKQLQELETRYKTNNQVIHAMELELARLVGAQRAADLAAAAHATQMNTLATATTRATAAQQAAQLVMKAGQFIWTAIGGWVGLLTTALTIGAIAWMNYGAAAKQAAADARNARQGIADDESLRRLSDAATKAQTELDGIARAIKVLEGDRDRAKPADLKAAYQKQIDELVRQQKDAQERLAKAQEDARLAAKAVGEGYARDAAADFLRNVDTEIQAIEQGTRNKTRAVELSYAEANKVAAGNAEKLSELAKLQNQAIAAVGKQDAEAQIAALEAARAQIEKAGGTGSEKAIAEIDRRLTAQYQALKNVQNLLKDPVFTQDPKKGPVKIDAADPALTFLRNLEESIAGMNAQIPSLLSGADALDVGLAAFDETLAKIQNQDFFGKTSKPLDDTDKMVLAGMASDEAKLKQALDGLKKVGDEVRARRPELQDALEYLANPLPNKVEDANTDRFEKTLAGLGMTVEEFARRLKRPVEEVRALLDQGFFQAGILDLQRATEKVVKDLESSGVMNETQRREHQARLIEIEHETNVKLAEQMLARAELMAPGKDRDALIANSKQLIEKSAELATNRLAQNAQTPMDAMLRNWQDTTYQMEQATANWANSTIDYFVKAAQTGKFEWGNLVEQILSDLLRIKLQQSIGNSLGSIFEQAGTWAASFFAFADGGIMSSMGSVPLKKYARGGIANSPQMAMFGEGSMPEAYVPLPDGRSIPVTMKGGGGAAPDVTVNVINQTSQSVTATKGQPRFDGKQYILDVVLSAAATPGPFRDSLRSMSK